MTESLHQEVVFAATPARLYALLMDSEQHAAFTGAPAQVSPEVGGACSWHDGKIIGRNLELIENQRIVQAWRAGHWAPGVYSVVKYELVAKGVQTQIVLDHTGFPEGNAEHLEPGWHARYWKPLAEFLAK